MEAKELRIGNYIHLSLLQEDSSFKYELVKVSPIEIRDADHFGNDWTGRPILLTEEWLLKFEFEKKKLYTWKGNGADWQSETSKTEQQDYVLDNESFFVRYTNWCFRKTENQEWHCDLSFDIFVGKWYVKSFENQINVKECKYVHQLQNLYFALTGEELELK
jgi:hypothetical protein